MRLRFSIAWILLATTPASAATIHSEPLGAVVLALEPGPKGSSLISRSLPLRCRERMLSHGVAPLLQGVTKA
jgi:hypothetical protein